MNRRKKPSEKLVDRLEADLDLLVSTWEFVRTGRGRSGASAGSFAWFFLSPDGKTVGSVDTVAQCLKADRLTASEPFPGTTEIHAEKKNEKVS